MEWVVAGECVCSLVSCVFLNKYDYLIFQITCAYPFLRYGPHLRTRLGLKISFLIGKKVRIGFQQPKQQRKRMWSSANDDRLLDTFRFVVFVSSSSSLNCYCRIAFFFFFVFDNTLAVVDIGLIAAVVNSTIAYRCRFIRTCSESKTDKSCVTG